MNESFTALEPLFFFKNYAKITKRQKMRIYKMWITTNSEQRIQYKFHQTQTLEATE